MRCVDPRAIVLGALKAWLVVVHASYKSTYEEDLGKLGAGIERVRANVCIDLFEGGEFGVGERGAVEVGGLENEAGVGRGLEIGEEGDGEEHLGEMIDLEMRV